MGIRSEEHTSELQSQSNLVCRLLLEKKKHTSELQSQSNLVCRLLLEKKKSPHTTNTKPISHSAILDATPLMSPLPMSGIPARPTELLTLSTHNVTSYIVSTVFTLELSAFLLLVLSSITIVLFFFVIIHCLCFFF